MGMDYPVIDSIISPEGKLDILSKAEIARLLDQGQTGLYQSFRNCALAVLSTGNYLDDGNALMERYPDFDIRVVHRERGIKLFIRGAPASAFVDGEMIRGIREHLFAVLRDILFTASERPAPHNGENDSALLTDFVFHILRNADVMQRAQDPKLVVCWGGHSISRSPNS